jgi:hypothetical protein
MYLHQFLSDVYLKEMRDIDKKTLNTNTCTKSLFSSIITHSYMFRAVDCALHSQQHILAKLYSAT